MTAPQEARLPAKAGKLKTGADAVLRLHQQQKSLKNRGLMRYYKSVQQKLGVSGNFPDAAMRFVRVFVTVSCPIEAFIQPIGGISL
jgi:hypothetical protein